LRAPVPQAATALRWLDVDGTGQAVGLNAFVGMQYYGYLRRKPEPTGLQAWLRVLQGGDIRTMVNGFLNSQEYRLRFGRPNQCRRARAQCRERGNLRRGKYSFFVARFLASCMRPRGRLYCLASPQSDSC
jgi:Domain of unknown function (DUF4214)